MMRNTIKSYLEKNIPFALFRAPNQPIRFVAQMSPLTEDNKIATSGFHFAPFSKRENVPHFVIKDEVNIVLENEKSIPNPTISKLAIPTFLENKNRMNIVDFSTYENHIQSYLDFFEKNETQKAIYSRIKKTELPEDFDLISFFEKIENAYPRAMVYIVNLPGLGLWAGASPEKLLTYKNGIAETVALAGTQKVLDEKNVENLTWGEKEIEEHGMVVDYILEKIENNNDIENNENIQLKNQLTPDNEGVWAMRWQKNVLNKASKASQKNTKTNKCHPERKQRSLEIPYPAYSLRMASVMPHSFSRL